MAEVYRALDERLGRQVALKVLTAELARNDEFRRRFIMESRVAAAEFRAALGTALARNPDDRFTDAAAFAAALSGTPEWLSVAGSEPARDEIL